MASCNEFRVRNHQNILIFFGVEYLQLRAQPLAQFTAYPEIQQGTNYFALQQTKLHRTKSGDADNVKICGNYFLHGGTTYSKCACKKLLCIFEA